MNRFAQLAFVGVVLLAVPQVGQADNGPRTGPVLARGDERDAIKSLDITERPDRWGHFYGNTVRRRYERSSEATRRPITRPRSA